MCFNECWIKSSFILTTSKVVQFFGSNSINCLKGKRLQQNLPERKHFCWGRNNNRDCKQFLKGPIKFIYCTLLGISGIQWSLTTLRNLLRRLKVTWTTIARRSSKWQSRVSSSPASQLCSPFQSRLPPHRVRGPGESQDGQLPQVLRVTQVQRGDRHLWLRREARPWGTGLHQRYQRSLDKHFTSGTKNSTFIKSVYK